MGKNGTTTGKNGGRANRIFENGKRENKRKEKKIKRSPRITECRKDAGRNVIKQNERKTVNIDFQICLGIVENICRRIYQSQKQIAESKAEEHKQSAYCRRRNE